MKKAQVVILAGGFGTRMSEQFPSVPKPMIPVNSKPILEHIVDECRKYGLLDILIVLHFGAERIKQHFGDGHRFGVALSYYIEEEPLGTGGALIAVQHLVASTYIVLYADVYCDVDFFSLMQFHHTSDSDVSIVIHPNSHPHDSDLVVLNESNRIIDISPHPHKNQRELKNLVNAAMYIFNKSVLKDFKINLKKFDIAQDLFSRLLEMDKYISGYRTVEYLKDMGTPERLASVEIDVKNGLDQSRSIRVKRRAIFLDRDGTINKANGFIKSSDQLELIKGSAHAIKKINKSKYLAICVTNQPVLARGDCDYKMLEKIHNKLEFLLGLQGSYLDKLFFCPHHPDTGFAGEVIELKKECDCRKPKPGMFLEAKSDLNIDLSESWMIGDRTADLAATKYFDGFNALVLTGDGGLDGKYPTRPNLVANNLDDAVNFITGPFENHRLFAKKLCSQLGSKKYIFIGGLVRSGKTTFASLLKSFLCKTGKSAHIIELDQFLLSTRKEEDQLFERYDLESLNTLVDSCQEKLAFKYHDFGFDHVLNEKIDYGVSTVSSEDVIIFEGIISLKLMEQLDIPNISVFVNAHESNRYEWFYDKYKNKSLSNAIVLKLWNQRKSEESETIFEDFAFVSLLFNNEASPK